MARDLQDIPPSPSGICVLIEDRFNVLQGLVSCSGDVESGCLEAFETNEYYKAYRLMVDTNYYTTEIQVRSFDKLSNYRQWYNEQQIGQPNPHSMFICVNVDKNEEELEGFLKQIDSLNVDQIDTRSLLLFGQLPCSINNVDHPKTKLIQKVIDQNYIEVVKFDPNEEELEELEENHEKYGINRVWELLGIVEWPTRIVKPGVGNYVSLSVPSTDSASSKSNTKRLSAMENLSRKAREESAMTKEELLFAEMEPNAEDERCIFEFLMKAKRTIPEPKVKAEKVPELSRKYLEEQRQRVQKGLQLSQTGYHSHYLNSWPYLAEATLVDRPQNVNTQMSIVDTTKRFEAGITSLNAASSIQPRTTVEEQISVGQSKKKKKSKNKKSTADGQNETVQEKVEKIFEQISLNEEVKVAVLDKNPKTDQDETQQSQPNKKPSDLSKHLTKLETKKDK